MIQTCMQPVEDVEIVVEREEGVNNLCDKPIIM